MTTPHVLVCDGKVAGTGRVRPMVDSILGARVLPASGHRRMRWVNGGGWTTEIVAEPTANDWEWRLSVADVDEAGPFSVFPGVDRTIALLHGRGFALTVGTASERVIDTAFQPFEFDGDATTTCRLIDGPVQDINLLVRRGTTPRRLDVVHIAPGSEIPLGAIDVAIVVAGRVRFEGHDLGFLDAIRVSRSGSIAVTAVGDEAIVAAASAHDHR